MIYWKTFMPMAVITLTILLHRFLAKVLCYKISRTCYTLFITFYYSITTLQSVHTDHSHLSMGNAVTHLYCL